MSDNHNVTQDYSTKVAKKNKKNNQPASHYEFILILQLLHQLVTRIEATTALKFIPYIDKEYQSTRGMSKIVGKSHGTVANWIREYGSEISKEKGGGQRD